MRKILQIVLLCLFVKCSTSSDSCSGVVCPPCQECVATTCSTGEICTKCVCSPICPQMCIYGYEYNSLGCPTCTCVDPCRNYICGGDEHCEVIPLSCLENSKYGYMAICVKNNTCEGVVCPSYHYCRVQTIYCLIPPCPPPYAVCQHYCGNQKLLIDDCGLAVQCSSTNTCPRNYICTQVPPDPRSFCCSSTSDTV